MTNDEFRKAYEERLYEAGYRYIVRNKSGYLNALKKKPTKDGNIWRHSFTSGTMLYEKSLFIYWEDIQWEDEEPYEIQEPPIDWSKVPIDTKVLVKGSYDVAWRKRYFAGLDENNIPLAFNNGCTSWSCKNSTTRWSCIKLAEEETENKS